MRTFFIFFFSAFLLAGCAGTLYVADSAGGETITLRRGGMNITITNNSRQDAVAHIGAGASPIGLWKDGVLQMARFVEVAPSDAVKVFIPQTYPRSRTITLMSTLWVGEERIKSSTRTFSFPNPNKEYRGDYLRWDIR